MSELLSFFQHPGLTAQQLQGLTEKINSVLGESGLTYSLDTEICYYIEADTEGNRIFHDAFCVLNGYYYYQILKSKGQHNNS